MNYSFSVVCTPKKYNNYMQDNIVTMNYSFSVVCTSVSFASFASSEGYNELQFFCSLYRTIPLCLSSRYWLQ